MWSRSHERDDALVDGEKMEHQSDAVIGHYIESQAKQWIPALAQSTELFKAVVNDDITRLEEIGDAGLLSYRTVLYWSDGKEATPKVEAKSRSLAQIACKHGSLRVLSYLLSKGANPHAAKDGLSCYEVGTHWVKSLAMMHYT